MGNTGASRRAAGSQQALPPGSLYGRRGERKYLTLDEQAALMRAASQLPVRQRLLIAMLRWTGARISEVLAITPGSIQLGSGVVAIVTLKRRRPVVREVPLPRDFIEEIAAEFSLGSGRTVSDSRLWPLSRSTAWRIVHKAMQAAGLRGPAACPRGLRHAFGVTTVQARVPLTALQRWMGHSRLTTTALYLDVSGPEERALAQRYWQIVERSRCLRPGSTIPQAGSGR